MGNRRPPITSHPRKKEIDEDLLMGVPNIEIARKYDLEQSAVSHYRKERFVPPKMRNKVIAKTLELKDNELVENEDVAKKLLDLERKARSLYDVALEEGKYQTAISALREITRVFELYVKIAAEVRQQQQVDIFQHPDFIEYQEGLIEILEQHPEAAKDLVKYVEEWQKTK